MKKLALLTLCVAASATIAGAANASGGCGRDFHRTPYGHCRANGVAVAPGLVIGNFYAGQGYWDGQRYWHHRYHDHDHGGGWHYR